MIVNCQYCNKPVEKETGHVNRAKKQNHNLYCNRICSGKARRVKRTDKEKKALKAEYDKEYRKKNYEKLKIKKQKYNQTPEGRAAQKRNREKRKDYHNAYWRKRDQRDKELIRRNKRLYGKDVYERQRVCVVCNQEKSLIEFRYSKLAPEERMYLCLKCEAEQNKLYHIRTTEIINIMRNKSTLSTKELLKHPELIEAKKMAIALTREIKKAK